MDIQPGRPELAQEIAKFWQPIYQATYPNSKYRINAEHFSDALFTSSHTLGYLRDTFRNDSTHRAYVAWNESKIVGTITIQRQPDYYEIQGFYVEVDSQGNGLGKQLMSHALQFYEGDLPIRVEVAETNKRTVQMYKRWGFVRDMGYGNNGVEEWHFEEWDEGEVNGYIRLNISPDRALRLKEGLLEKV